MSIALFIANIEMNMKEGITKKVFAQAKSFGRCFENCFLFLKSEKKTVVYNTKNDSFDIINEKLLVYICKFIKERDDIKSVYVRHMVPSFKLLNLLYLFKKKKIKLFYEIPTYPYFYEQIKASRKKYRALAKIMLDILFAPFIYSKIDKLIIIKSNSKVRMYKKMIPISNGVFSELKYRRKNNHPNIFRVFTIGTFYHYHGYDRIIKSLYECNERIDEYQIEFHIIGNGNIIEELKKEADRLKLKNVFFHGVKSTAEIDEMIVNYDLGLGCLALHRRRADIDTTLKVIEYYCRGIPVVSSGFCPLEKYSYLVNDDDSVVDFKRLIQFTYSFSEEELESLSILSNDRFSWDTIMKSLVEEVN